MIKLTPCRDIVFVSATQNRPSFSGITSGINKELDLTRTIDIMAVVSIKIPIPIPIPISEDSEVPDLHFQKLCSDFLTLTVLSLWAPNSSKQKLCGHFLTLVCLFL